MGYEWGIRHLISNSLGPLAPTVTLDGSLFLIVTRDVNWNSGDASAAATLHFSAAAVVPWPWAPECRGRDPVGRFPGRFFAVLLKAAAV